MLVSKRTSYLHTDSDLSALDLAEYVRLYGERRNVAGRRDQLGKQLKAAKGSHRKEVAAQIAELNLKITKLVDAMRRCVAWKVACDCRLSLIQCGNTLVAGGAGKIAAFDVEAGKEIWRRALSGNVYGLALAGGRLYASTDQGKIYCFAADDRTAAH